MSEKLISRHPSSNLSHVCGLQEEPLLELTIPQLLSKAQRESEAKEALIFCEQGIRKSYKEFSDDVDSFAWGLYNLGLKKLDRVGVWSHNRYEWIIVQFATARLGIILVNINPAYGIYELEYALNKVECSALIMSSGFKSSDYVDDILKISPELVHQEKYKLSLAKLPHLKQIIIMDDNIHTGMISFEEVLNVSPNIGKLDEITNTLWPTDPINIQFTSGTTGRPKGATLTHKNIVNNAFFVMEAMNFTSTDRLCVPVPFYHCFGMVMGTLGCVSKNAVMVIPGQGFDALKTLKAIAEEKCTGVYGVATMFNSELELSNFSSFDLSSLRTGIMAGGPCPIELMRKVQSKMNMTEITIAYGMTETSPVSFQSNVSDPLEKRVTSVGRVHPHVEVKIVDQLGNIVPVGDQGELCTRGYSVMMGYWNDEDRTKETIDDDGWLRTGDLANMDSNGYVNVTGRLKDMIVRGGENIYPREIEEFMYSHPSISHVQVFGVPDKVLGEAVCAWIILRDGKFVSEKEIINFCKRKLAYFKIPKYINFVQEVPMTITGKPQKFLMREIMINKLNLVEQATA